MVRQIILKKLNGIKYLINKNNILNILRDTSIFKIQSKNLLRLWWSHHCEYVLGQKFKKGHKMVTFYTKLWNDEILKIFLKRVKQQLFGKRRDLIYMAMGVTSYNWEKNRIPMQDIKDHINDLDYINVLMQNTICTICLKPHNKTGNKVCHCGEDKSENKNDKHIEYDKWKLFIKKKDLIIWRRQHASGSFEYKVYGSYNDVTAEDFLNVQIDINYRKKWDNTAVSLKLIEADSTPNSNSDIIYWEMQWPRLFANRDYVFIRRFAVDYDTNTLIVVNKCTEHSEYPKDDKKFRVLDYWSYMVIKPHTEINRPGIEFSLTYYDNPGVNIPTSITNWVAMRAMPDFLERLREAAKQYKTYCLQAGVKCIFKLTTGITDIVQPIIHYSYYDEDIITDNTIFEAQYNIKDKVKTLPPPDGGNNSDTTSTITIEQINNNNNNNEGFSKYFHLTYYFS